MILCSNLEFSLFCIFSDLPAPVAASVNPDSPTKELESILEDLLGLGQEVSTVSVGLCAKITETLNKA